MASQAAITVLTADVEDPSGYGRIVYGKDERIARIVEERDASDDEKKIREINTSIMVVRKSLLGPGLRLVGRQNAQNEYYLTDIVKFAVADGHTVVAQVQLVCEMMGMSLKAMVSIVSGTVTRCSGRTAESKYHPPSAYNRL